MSDASCGPVPVVGHSRRTVRCRNDRPPRSPSTAARFIGQSVTRKEDRPAAHRARGVRRRHLRCRGMLHAAFVRSEIAQRHDHQHRHDGRESGAGCRRPSTRGTTSTATSARRGTPCSARTWSFRRRSRSATSATSATPSRSSSPRAAPSPRTRASWSRSSTSRAKPLSTSPPPPPTPSTSCTPHGGSSPTRWSPCRSCPFPPTSRRRSTPPSMSWSARSSRTATSPCRWRPGGSSPRGRGGATRWRSCAPPSRCTRRATSSRAISTSLKEASPSPHTMSAAGSARRCSCSARSAPSSSRRACSPSR